MEQSVMQPKVRGLLARRPGASPGAVRRGGSAVCIRSLVRGEAWHGAAGEDAGEARPELAHHGVHAATEQELEVEVVTLKSWLVVETLVLEEIFYSLPVKQPLQVAVDTFPSSQGFQRRHRVVTLM